MRSRKLLKNLAEKIASYERIIMQNNSPEEVNKAKDAIAKLTENSKLNFDEMILVDELILEFLEKI